MGKRYLFSRELLENHLLHKVFLNQLQIKSYFSTSNLPFYSNEFFFITWKFLALILLQIGSRQFVFSVTTAASPYVSPSPRSDQESCLLPFAELLQQLLCWSGNPADQGDVLGQCLEILPSSPILASLPLPCPLLSRLQETPSLCTP